MATPEHCGNESDKLSKKSSLRSTEVLPKVERLSISLTKQHR